MANSWGHTNETKKPHPIYVKQNLFFCLIQVLDFLIKMFVWLNVISSVMHVYFLLYSITYFLLYFVTSFYIVNAGSN